MSEAGAFWSYVHRDDEAEGGRISQLARHVVAQYNMITGIGINLFLDRDDLEWGDEWREKVDASLAAVAFFIPVLTPRYFQSAECRRELNFFLRRASDLGVRDLVMPILYIDVPDLHVEEPSDPAISLVKPFQWVDWTELRFEDLDSGQYRRAVAGLATRLADAATKIEQVDVTSAALKLGEREGTEAPDEEPGVLDQMARAEEAMPQWVETMEAIVREIEVIGEVAASAGADIERGNAQGKGIAARLTILRSFAQALNEPSRAIEELGARFTTQLNDVDVGIRTIIDRAPGEVQENPGARSDTCEFYDTLRTMAASAEEGFGGLTGMVNSIAPVENMSRDLRPALRRLRKGLTLITEGREVIQEWVALIDASPIVCGDVAD